MKILIFGAQRISVDIIRYLATKTDVDICGVVSSDQERDKLFSEYLLGEFCTMNNIPILRTDVEVSNICPDIIFSLYYRKIVSQEVLKIPKFGAVNLHPALLPKYRGCVPTYWAIINGEQFTGTTLHYMTGGIDDGNIIDQVAVEIGDRTGPELHSLIMDEGFALFKKNINSILSGTNISIVQNHTMATYFGPYRSQFRYINWNNTSENIIRHIRAHNTPFQGSVAWNNYCEIKIDNAIIILENGWPAGKYQFDGNNILVQTQNSRILIAKWELLDGRLKKEGMFVSGSK